MANETISRINDPEEVYAERLAALRKILDPVGCKVLCRGIDDVWIIYESYGTGADFEADSIDEIEAWVSSRLPERILIDARSSLLWDHRNRTSSRRRTSRP